MRRFQGFLVVLAVTLLVYVGVASTQQAPFPRSSGSFQPTDDQVVSGRWTFTHAAPIVLWGQTGLLKANGSNAVSALTTSAGLSGTLSDETGSGALVFGTAPTISPIYPVTTIAGDGAITIASGIVALTKGSAAAITLAAPTTGQAGTELIITAGSAFAHVVTATALIEDGVTGGSKTTLTFGAFNGATITLRAYNLKWTVVSKNVVTIT